MKNVLLYGDSFFWGVNSKGGSRHKFQNRIDRICQLNLGEDYFVVAEGLRGRTMFGENGWFPERNGLAQFGPIFASHLPVDVIVIMLGTNDLNSKTNHSPSDIANALDEYIEKMKFWCDFMKYDLPKLVIVSPPGINEDDLDAFKEIFKNSAPKVASLSVALRQFAQQRNHTFLDAANIVHSYDEDGIHINVPENKKIADEFVQIIKTLT